MKTIGKSLRLSASDLANHLACRHLTQLDLSVARGQRQAPDWRHPDVAVLAERGEEHENAFLAHLEKQGVRVALLPSDDGDDRRAFERTLSAMREGADAIAQATLVDGSWLGRADLLRRVPRSSRLGDWSYEVWDTKLARETKAGSVLQICLYSDLLGTIQGAPPEHMYIVPPRDDFRPDAYRFDEYAAYYRLVRRRLEATVAATNSSPPPQGSLPFGSSQAAAQGTALTYPEPVAHCDVCRWWPTCDAQRRADDHLSLVAGISRLQRHELQARSVGTLARLASEPLPIGWKPGRGAVESYTRVREQARVQVDGRRIGRVVYELLPPQPGLGLERLPAPSAGDIFFDFEGDPFVPPSGREYLFGWATEESGAAQYRCLWALDEAAEKKTFETFIDLVMERWARHPDLHIYHFAPYEPSAVKRLMGRYATRENEVDRMLRAGVFVDLHAVIKQAMRASVEEYSLKKLEALYAFEREATLDDAGVHLRIVQRALELEEPDAITGVVRGVVEAYNRDDCVSTLRMYRWLEEIRAGVEKGGRDVPRPEIAAGQPSEAVADRDRAVKEAMAALLDGLPAARADRDEEQQARWLLAYMLEWHRREEKSSWWELFRLRELSDEDLLDEKDAIAGLEHVGRVTVPGKGKAKSKVVERYRFPAQETSLREGARLRIPLPLDKEFGKVLAIDLAGRTVDIERRNAIHPTAVFAHEMYATKEQPASLLRLGRWVVEHGVDASGAHRAARDLLLGRPPRIIGHAGGPLRADRETGLEAARRMVMRLGAGTLAIQGPPGTGKTHTGSRMICELVRAGKKVGVCATSHKVIRNLLDKVVEAAKEENVSPRCHQKVSDEDDAGDEASGITPVYDNDDALDVVRTGAACVLGGTAWLWSREEFFEAVDVLFVDEAGQMSLANFLAIAQGARSIVLLGDPRQLEQPLKGSHPEGTELSALEHLLQDFDNPAMGHTERRKTIPPDRGLFLEETWRLHPAICRLTSELFYDGRLNARPGLERQEILGSGPIAGAGLWYVPVEHDGNQGSSREEVATVSALVGRLTDGTVRWRNAKGGEAPLRLDDILIIAPYNAQVADLAAALPRGARIGTVDRFQGREAPVVIYSMTTSTPADAPRGMEFLYSLNRFNVATSRARCACIVVGSPRLFEPECQTPRQMQLANACCRYLELAREAPPDAILAPARR